MPESACFKSDNGWKQHIWTEQEKEKLRLFYFDEVVRFRTEMCTSYELPIDQTLSIDDKAFTVTGLKIWWMPAGIVLFGIIIKITAMPLGDMLKLLNQLRSISRYNENMTSFTELAISPIDQVYRRCNAVTSQGLMHLVENGNKLKVYQIVSAHDVPVEKEDHYLYSLGTFFPHIEGDPMAGSESYVKEVLDAGGISVFNNWKCLVLCDSMTYLVKGSVPEWTIRSWSTEYLEFIYLYHLYRQFYFYHLNRMYHQGRKALPDIKEALELMEQQMTFFKISYNFLPDYINGIVSRNITPQQELDHLNTLIQHDVESVEHDRERRMNNFLLALTLLASLSAVWDISCMVDAMIRYETVFGTTEYGFRAVILFTEVLIVMCAIFFIKQKKK